VITASAQRGPRQLFVSSSSFAFALVLNSAGRVYYCGPHPHLTWENKKTKAAVMAQPLTWLSPLRRRRRTTTNNFRCAKDFPLFVLFFFSSESPNHHSDSEVKEAEAKEEEEAYRRPMSTISSVCRRAVFVCFQAV